MLDALASLRLAAGPAEAIAARVEVSSAYPASDLDASVLAETGAGFGRFDTFGVEGGNSRLAEALAAPLGPALLLESPGRGSRVGPALRGRPRVRRPRGVGTARCPGRASSGDACYSLRSAAPGGQGPVAPPQVADGQAAKLHLPLAARAAPSAVLAVPARYWTYTQLGPDGSPAPFAASFAGTPGALERLRVWAGAGTWAAAVAGLRPELELDHSLTAPYLSTLA